MGRLVAEGRILRWAVSNLHTDDMEELVANGGTGCQTDKILYNLTQRGPEHDSIRWPARHDMPVMANSPVEQGRLIAHSGLADLCGPRDATLLAWLLARDGILLIRKVRSLPPCLREPRRAQPRAIRG